MRANANTENGAESLLNGRPRDVFGVYLAFFSRHGKRQDLTLMIELLNHRNSVNDMSSWS